MSNFGLYFQKLGGQTASPGESSKGSRLLYYILFSMTTIVEHSLAQPTLVRDVSAGVTGATEVAPKFSDTLTLSQPGGADSANHRIGRP